MKCKWSLANTEMALDFFLGSGFVTKTSCIAECWRGAGLGHPAMGIPNAICYSLRLAPG